MEVAKRTASNILESGPKEMKNKVQMENKTISGCPCTMERKWRRK
jgi:hypothetical protein